MRTGLTRREALRMMGVASGALALAGCASASDLLPTPETWVTVDDAPATQAAADPATEAATSEPAAETPEPGAAERLLASMALEQKVAQLFFVTPEQLTGVECATISGELTQEALGRIPVGGLAYFSKNITGSQQLTTMLSGAVELSRAAGAGVPAFTGVDEEGGPLVARVANSGCFDVETFPNMAEIGASGDASQASQVGTTIGGYLKDIGFSLDFAPVADVLTNPENTAIGARSFGADPDLVASMVSAEVKAMLATGTLPCAKHFPGHGDTAGDSHTGEAVSERSLDELEGCEYKPFSAAIEAGVPFVMVGHIKTPNAAADDLPASLSSYMMQETLRGQLGFGGVIISDSFSMGAITQYYDQSDAAVRFLAAGGDMILMPADLGAAYQGVLDAVAAGTLTEQRIEESVARVLAAKQQAGLLP